MIPADRIRDAAASYLGWSYRAPSQAAKVAARGGALWVPSAVVHKDGDPLVTDCCTFVAGILADAYPEATWQHSSWSKLMITDARDPWSPIAALIEAGIGKELARPVGARWHVVQGWSGLGTGVDSGKPYVIPGSRGHTWLSWGPDTILQAAGPGLGIGWTSRPWAVQSARWTATRIVVLA